MFSLSKKSVSGEERSNRRDWKRIIEIHFYLIALLFLGCLLSPVLKKNGSAFRGCQIKGDKTHVPHDDDDVCSSWIVGAAGANREPSATCRRLRPNLPRRPHQWLVGASSLPDERRQLARYIARLPPLRWPGDQQ